MGFMAAIDGELTIRKELHDVDKFYGLYEELKTKHPQAPFVIHFRLSTQGGVTFDNLHPFIIHENFGFAHNGVISQMREWNSNKSDTRLFNERILKKLPKFFHRNETIMDFLTAYTQSDKLVYMSGDGFAMISGYNLGDTDEEGNWFSNTYWKYGSYYGSSYSKGSSGVIVGGSYNNYNSAGKADWEWDSLKKTWKKSYEK